MKKSARSEKAIRPNARITKDSFQNFEARIGYGTGDVADGGGYSVDFISKNRFRLEAMYRSSWICGKAVDSVAEDMTKRGIEINSEIEPGEVDELMRLWKQLRLWDALADTVKWSRLYGGAVAVLLIDGQNFATPLRIETVKKDQFKGLLALDRWQLQPSLQDLVSDLGPDLGMPSFYDVVGNARLLQQTRIHYTRVIRLDGQDLPYFQKISENLWGQSVLERLYDRLLAFDSTTQGAAQLV
jgi:phage-related protein (TIGR01555 family)